MGEVHDVELGLEEIEAATGEPRFRRQITDALAALRDAGVAPYDRLRVGMGGGPPPGGP